MAQQQTTQQQNLEATERQFDHSAYKEYLFDITYEHLKRNFPDFKRFKDMNVPLTGPHGIRKLLGEIDIEYFGKAYFPDYYMYEVPKFHRDLYKLLCEIENGRGGRKIVKAWPRGFAKTTIIAFIFPIHAGLYEKKRFTLLVGDTQTQAENFLGNIKVEIEENEYIQQDFGNVQGSPWKGQAIEFANKARFEAFGAEASFRGVRRRQWRPDLVVIDDLEDDEAVLTPDRIEKRYRWFTRVLLNIGDRYTDYIYLGTLLAPDCVIARVLDNPSWEQEKLSAVIKFSSSPLWDRWQKLYTDLTDRDRKETARKFFFANKEEMLAGTEVLWPEKHSYYDLMVKRIEDGELAFECEQQNNPVDMSMCPLKEEDISFYTNSEIEILDFKEYFGAVDPSLGKSDEGSYSAIITIGRANNGYLYCLDADIQRRPPDQIIEAIISKAEVFPYALFVVETHQFQDLFKMNLLEECIKRKVKLPLVDVKHQKDKRLRIMGVIPLIKNGYVKFHRNQTELIKQLIFFPQYKFLDGPDALEMCLKAAWQSVVSEPLVLDDVVGDSAWVVDDEENEFDTLNYYVV